jgi:hypothetical protein
MNLDVIKELLLYCLAFNYGVLVIWFVVFRFAHDFVYRLHSRWFILSIETFDQLHYASMAFYKIGIIILNIAPLVAFWLTF